jgi:hypothetical protein
MTQFIVSINDQKPQRRACSSVHTRLRAKCSARCLTPLRAAAAAALFPAVRARSEKFIIHALDDCHLLVQAHVVTDIQARAQCDGRGAKL